GLIELFWPKQRILEVYLNSVERGDGVFGAEAAAQHHSGVGAPYLSGRQPSRLAALPPHPRPRPPTRPSPHAQRPATWSRRQTQQLGGSHYLNQLNAPLALPQWWPEWLPRP